MANAVKKVGRYSIFDAFASGGMATVHLARLSGPAGFSRTVAVKRLHPELGREPELVAAFADEARLCSRIQHPNVVPIVDVVADATELCLVMEYVPGVSLGWLLHELRNAGRRVPPEVALVICDSMLSGLSAAHRATDERGQPLGLVHRDVSPQNVLLGSDGVVRILDFGVAKASGRSQATRGSVWKGKPAYMAPEQLRGEEIDARSDVYACAVVLWEMLTGHRLFSADSDQATARRALEKIVDAPSRVVAGLPHGLDAVVMRGLERDIDSRFESAEAMQRELRRLGPLPGGDRVAELVQEIGDDVLAQRARLLAEVERASEPTAQAAGAVPAARRARWPWWIAALGAGGVLVWLAWPAPRLPAAANPTPPSAAPGAKPVASTSPPIVGSAASSAPEPIPSASIVRAGPHAGRPLAAPSGKGPDCDPPYVVDSEGFHRMKPECLK